MPLVLNVPSLDTKVAGAHMHVSGLDGLIHATRRASAVVGVDSGPLHLAAALEKPGVAIFGPTDPERNGPYGDTLTVLRNPQAITSYKRRPEIDSCMRAISVDQVFETLRAQLLCTAH
jgi:heptosyltransferase-1